MLGTEVYLWLTSHENTYDVKLLSSLKIKLKKKDKQKQKKQNKKKTHTNTQTCIIEISRMVWNTGTYLEFFLKTFWWY